MALQLAGRRERIAGGFLTLTGWLLLLAGVAIGLLAPLEMICFYWFSEGGRFTYEGFRFGSFMFGNIAAQIAGYYLISAVCITLGYGHIVKKRWTRPLSLALLWAWLVIGAPLVVLAGFILLATKELGLAGVIAAAVFAVALYGVLPAIGIPLYRSAAARRIFELGHPQPGWWDTTPMAVLIQCCLYPFFFLMFHLLILFNGIFPVFGTFVYGLPGIALIDASLACMALLFWGTVRRMRWAWWGGLVFWGWIALSTILSFANTGWLDLLRGLAFPALEVGWLDGIPLQGWHLALMTGVPLMGMWGAIVASGLEWRRPISLSMNQK